MRKIWFVGLVPVLGMAIGNACSTFGSAQGEVDASVTGRDDASAVDPGTLPGLPPRPDGATPISLKIELLDQTALVGVRGKAPVPVRVRVTPASAGLDLSVSGLPLGATSAVVNADVGTGLGTLTISLAQSTRSGTFPISVKASGAGAVTAALDATLEVRGAPGEVDESFGTNGLVLNDLGPRETPLDALVLDDGRIVVGGYDAAGPFVRRYRADGPLDPTFGVNGTKRLLVTWDGGKVDALILVPPSTLLAAATNGRGGDQVGFFRIDDTPTTAPLIRAIPAVNMREVVSIEVRDGASMVALGHGGSGWVIASFDQTTGAPAAWGQGSSGFAYGGVDTPALAFFRRSTDDVALAEAAGGIRAIRLNKQGIVTGQSLMSGVGYLGATALADGKIVVGDIRETGAGAATFGLYTTDGNTATELGLRRPGAGRAQLYGRGFLATPAGYVLASERQDPGTESRLRAAFFRKDGSAETAVAEAGLVELTFLAGETQSFPARLLWQKTTQKVVVVAGVEGPGGGAMAMRRIWL